MDEKDFLPPATIIENTPGVHFKPTRINTIQDVVDTLSYCFNQIWNDDRELSSPENRYWKMIVSDWAKQQIAAVKERDAHSPEVAAKQLEDQLRIVTGAKKLDPARMHEILTSRNFGFALEQYMVDVEVIEDKKDDSSNGTKEALDQLQKKGLLGEAAEYFDTEIDEDGGGIGGAARPIDELSF